VESIERHLKLIEKVKDDPRKAFLVPRNYEALLRGVISESLQKTSNPKEFSKRLSANDALKYFSDFIETSIKYDNDKYFTALTIDLLAIPSLLSDKILLEKFMVMLVTPKECGSKIWRQYAKAIDNLMGNDNEFNSSNKGSKIENHWNLYIDYIKALKSNGDIKLIQEKISKSFTSCNTDKRITQATYIDPCGSNPKPWDLRLYSIGNIYEMYST
jgi:hypothetical protein